MGANSFPITRERALALIREAVRCGNVLIPDPPDGGEWYRLMSRRQVDLCLKEGDLIEEPDIDGYGHVRCVLERFGAGLTVRVHIALMKREGAWIITVIEIENRR